jgi:hypothetical protein
MRSRRIGREGGCQPVNHNSTPRALSKTGDAAALERVLVTDRQQAFQQIVDDHYASLLSYAHFLLGRGGAVEDVVHQAFLLGIQEIEPAK